MRCFIALPLPEETRTLLLPPLRSARKLEPEWRWIGPDALHLTLAFLGEIDGTTLECARSAVLAVAGTGAFGLPVSGLTTFPSGGRPRVIALELGEAKDRGSNPCAGLWRLVNEKLAVACARARVRNPNAEWPDGRPFRAHLTLARAKTGALRPDIPALWNLFGGAAQAPIALDACILYGSELRPDGAKHTELARVALGSARETPPGVP
ncbi:MAG: RNA 2',3'-cyclic phosphodiesterase [Spirochaetes bacterium]|nr:RNA 2',3'-cyclic phosphodiesterase [Spirochaetota bacterium]